jgi:hypothetical protein
MQAGRGLQVYCMRWKDEFRAQAAQAELDRVPLLRRSLAAAGRLNGCAWGAWLAAAAEAGPAESARWVAWARARHVDRVALVLLDGVAEGEALAWPALGAACARGLSKLEDSDGGPLRFGPHVRDWSALGLAPPDSAP